MGKLIRFLLLLVVGMILGYVFHDPIDTKLKAKFGNDRVENAKTATKNGINSTIEVSKVVGKKAVGVVKDAIDTVKKN